MMILLLIIIVAVFLKPGPGHFFAAERVYKVSGVHKGGLVKGGLAMRHVFNLHVKNGT